MPSHVRKKKLKMCQLIRGQGGNIEFQIDLKSNNAWSGPHKEQLWQVWSRSRQPFLRISSKCEKLTDAEPWHKFT